MPTDAIVTWDMARSSSSGRRQKGATATDLARAINRSKTCSPRLCCRISQSAARTATISRQSLPPSQISTTPSRAPQSPTGAAERGEFAPPEPLARSCPRDWPDRLAHVGQPGGKSAGNGGVPGPTNTAQDSRNSLIPTIRQRVRHKCRRPDSNRYAPFGSKGF